MPDDRDSWGDFVRLLDVTMRQRRALFGPAPVTVVTVTAPALDPTDTDDDQEVSQP